jgi:hypothetical protein
MLATAIVVLGTFAVIGIGADSLAHWLGVR